MADTNSFNNNNNNQYSDDLPELSPSKKRAKVTEAPFLDLKDSTVPYQKYKAFIGHTIKICPPDSDNNLGVQVSIENDTVSVLFGQFVLYGKRPSFYRDHEQKPWLHNLPYLKLSKEEFAELKRILNLIDKEIKLLEAHPKE